MLFGKILVAFDGSALSKKALLKAVTLTQEISSITRPARLEVIHVTHHSNYYFVGTLVPVQAGAYYNHHEEVQPMIDEIKELIAPLENVKVIIKQGSPAATILEYAEESSADLIVMGSRGLGSIKEFFLGSVSHDVVQEARIPVLIVK
jgi:nucleotide-binding universal stress UspA family protein